MLPLFCLLVLIHVSAAQEKFTLPPDCALPLDRGNNQCAAKNSTIRYFMDPATLTCLAFRHHGCGGNKNNFETKGDCHQTCIPMDFLSCPANSAPSKRPDGSSNCSNGPVESQQCPKGAVCKQGFAVGICCDEKISDKVNANYKPDCGPSKKVYKSEQFGFQLIHLGKSCDHGFCPSNSTCHMGAFFAYCCY